MIIGQFKVKWNIIRLLQSSDRLRVSHCTIVLVLADARPPLKRCVTSVLAESCCHSFCSTTVKRLQPKRKTAKGRSCVHEEEKPPEC